MNAEAYRHVPYDIDVEQALLGAILNDNQALERATAILKPEHFYDPLHARIFETMSHMIERGGMAVMPLTLHATMKSDPGVMVLGGQGYFDEIMMATPALPDVEDLARVITGLAVRRKLVEFGTDIVNAAHAPPTEISLDDQINAAEQGLRSIREQSASTHATAIVNSADFVADFVSPDYLHQGILQRGYLYSLTAKTGAGKTAILLRYLAHVGLGIPLSGREITQGRALMLVGENADDVRARWIAQTEHLGRLPSELDVFFMPGVFSISENYQRIRAQAEKVGGYALVGVDTSAAYFAGDEENSNTQLGDHARILRTLTRLPGTPCVLTPCHPTKNADENNLLPRGGGAFLAEVDGNLVASKKDGSTEVHWHGKFRGPDFEPMAFEMLTVTSDKLVDSKARRMPTVIAIPITEVEQMQRADAADRDKLRLIAVMLKNPGASMAVLAEKAGWYLASGSVHKSKVQRLLAELEKTKLASKSLGNKYALTAAGEKQAKLVST